MSSVDPRHTASPTQPTGTGRGDEAADRRQRRGTVPSDVADHLRRRILTGGLRAGQRIDQHQVAVELGVSRSPIREAVVLLSQEGLLELLPNRGAQVCQLRPDDVADHFRLLGEVAGDAAAIGAEQFGEEDRRQLRRIVERGAATPAGDADEHERLDREFHRVIASAASHRTRWLVDLLVRSLPIDTVGLGSAWIATGQQGRVEIVEAIERRDPETARTAIRRHLDVAGKQMVELLERRGLWDANQAMKTAPQNNGRGLNELR